MEVLIFDTSSDLPEPPRGRGFGLPKGLPSPCLLFSPSFLSVSLFATLPAVLASLFQCHSPFPYLPPSHVCFRSAALHSPQGTAPLPRPSFLTVIPAINQQHAHKHESCFPRQRDNQECGSRQDVQMLCSRCSKCYMPVCDTCSQEFHSSLSAELT